MSGQGLTSCEKKLKKHLDWDVMVQIFNSSIPEAVAGRPLSLGCWAR